MRAPPSRHGQLTDDLPPFYSNGRLLNVLQADWFNLPFRLLGSDYLDYPDMAAFKYQNWSIPNDSV